MGFFCVLLYVALTYLSPESLVPQLAPYRLVLWLAIAGTLVSIPKLPDQEWLWNAPQTSLLIGLVGAMMLSHVAHLWLGGTLFTLEEFLPIAIIFFFICIHVQTWRRLRILVVLLSAIAFFLLGHALWALHAGDINSPYLMSFHVDQGDTRTFLTRIRAVGYLADPNDFSQFLLVVLPFISLAWETSKRIRNFALVIVPSVIIIWGVYLTHSRGAMIALLVLSVIFLSRRISSPVSIGAGVLAYVGMMKLGWTGGREVSMEGGSDRIYLWEQALHIFRSSPIWGVGYGKFTDYTDGWTAHNSYMLCLAEVGVIGYTFWLAAIVITFLHLNSITRADDKDPESAALSDATDDVPQSAQTRPCSNSEAVESKTAERQRPQAEQLRRWATALQYSLCAFLVTAWFLSRTYTMTLYILLGMAAVLVHQAKDSPEQTKERRRHWIQITALAELATIAAVYLIARLQGS
jgi:O-antigen ligase